MVLRGGRKIHVDSIRIGFAANPNHLALYVSMDAQEIVQRTGAQDLGSITQDVLDGDPTTDHEPAPDEPPFPIASRKDSILAARA